MMLAVLLLAALAIPGNAAVTFLLVRNPQRMREHDYGIGYDHGVADGRRQARPVVVPLLRADLGDSDAGRHRAG
jgi:hypothetical protein